MLEGSKHQRMAACLLLYCPAQTGDDVLQRPQHYEQHHTRFSWQGKRLRAHQSAKPSRACLRKWVLRGPAGELRWEVLADRDRTTPTGEKLETTTTTNLNKITYNQCYVNAGVQGTSSLSPPIEQPVTSGCGGAQLSLSQLLLVLDPSQTSMQ